MSNGCCYTDGDCADANKDHLPNSEELQRINDELEKEYVFALKKVKMLTAESCFCTYFVNNEQCACIAVNYSNV